MESKQKRLRAADHLRPHELGEPDTSRQIGSTIVVTDGHDTFTIAIHADPGMPDQGIAPFHDAAVRMVGPDIARPKHLTASTWEGALGLALIEVRQSLQVGITLREEARVRR